MEFENPPGHLTQKNASTLETQTEKFTQEEFEFSEIKEVSFEAHAQKTLKRLFQEALRELGFFGGSNEFSGAHLFLRDKDNKNTVELGMNVENGEYLLRLTTEQHREANKPQPTKIVWGKPNA